jgi:hypothetical protein
VSDTIRSRLQGPQVAVGATCAGAFVLCAAAMAGGELPALTAAAGVFVVGFLLVRSMHLSMAGTCLLASIGVAVVCRSNLLPTLFERLTIPLAAATLIPAFLARTRSHAGKQTLYLATLAFSTIISSLIYGGTSTALTATALMSYWGLTLLVSRSLSSRERYLVVCVILALGVAEALIAIGESGLASTTIRSQIAATPDGIYVQRPNQILGGTFTRAQGSLGYPIAFANFLVACLAVLLIYWTKFRRTLRLSLSTLFIVGILLSGTRAGFIAVPAVIVTAILVGNTGASLKSRKSLSAALRIPFVAVLVLAASMGIARFAASTDILANFSFLHRFGVLSASPKLLSRPPLQTAIGSGLNSHEQYFRSGMLPGDQTFAVDNAYVMVLITSGLLGVVVFVALIVRGFLANRGRMAPAILAYGIFFFFYDGHLWQITSGLLLTFVGFALASDSETSAPDTTSGSISARSR